MKLACINPADVAALWESAPALRQMIKRAFDKTRLGTFADTETEILNGTQLLWVCHDHGVPVAAGSTRLINTDAGKVCLIVAGGGSNPGNLFADCMRGIEAYAKAEGCVSTRIIGRKGWGRILDGYKSRFVINEKAL